MVSATLSTSSYTSYLNSLYHKANEYVGGNALRQTLLATGILGSSLVARCVIPMQGSSLFYLASSVELAAGTVLIKNVYQWGHVPFHLVIQPLLFVYGIKWRIKENKDKKFIPNTCELVEKVVGSLKYENVGGMEIPILETEMAPYLKGLVQGSLMASQIVTLYERVLGPLMTFAQLRGGDVKGSWLRQKSQDYTFPDEYIQEMRGLCTAVNLYCKTNHLKFHLTEEILKNAHCFADTYKSSGGQSLFNSSVPSYISNLMMGDLGCSVAVKKGKNGFIIARNLDWPGLEMGPYAYIRREKASDGQVIETHTYPGIIGATTTLRLDEKGNISLVLIVNERSEFSMDKGIPYCLWVKSCINECKDIEEVQRYVDTHELPASSFHLIAVDKQDCYNYQFHPEPGQAYSLRKIDPTHELVITNHLVDPKTGEAGQEVCNNARLQRSLKRFQMMEEIFRKATEVNYQTARTSLNQTNTYWTMSSMVFEEGTSKRVYANATTYAALDLPEELR